MFKYFVKVSRLFVFMYSYVKRGDVKVAMSLSFKLKSATSDEHLASYKLVDEWMLVSQL